MGGNFGFQGGGGGVTPPTDFTNPTTGFLPVKEGANFYDSPLSAIPPPSGYVGYTGVQTQVGLLVTPPSGVDQSNIAPYLPYYGLGVQNTPFAGYKSAIGDYINQQYLTFGLYDNPSVGSSFVRLNNNQGSHLYMDFASQIYYFGFQYNAYPNPIIGLQINGGTGTFSLNAGSSPFNPPLQYNAPSGLMVMRDSFSPSIIGYNNGDAYVQSFGTIVFSSNFPIQFTNANMFLNGGGTFTIAPKALKIIDESGNPYFLPLYTI